MTFGTQASNSSHSPSKMGASMDGMRRLGLEAEPRGSFGRTRSRFSALFALLFVTLFSNHQAYSGSIPAGGWKQSLHHAGLVRKSGGTNIIRATGNHVKTHVKAYVDPAQAAVQRLGIHVPASIGPGPMNTIEPKKTTQFLNQLTTQRAINPTRFDHYHPVIGKLLNAQTLLQSPNGATTANIALAEKVLLPDTIYYRYFEARRALDPARFDTYHPLFGPLLAENQRVKNLLNAAEVLTPPSSQSVPEPSIMVLFAVGGGLLAAGRAFRRRRSTQDA